MKYQVIMQPSAEKQLGKLSVHLQKRLRDALRTLSDNPRPHGCRKLAGSDNLWRMQSGDYRVIYTISDNELLVLVIKIGHRRDVYR